MKKILVLFFLVLSWVGKAQTPTIEQEKQKAEARLSPFQTIYLHYYSLSYDKYNPKLSASTLYPAYSSAKEAENLAIKLRQIFDANGLYIDEAKLPRNANHYDSTAKKYIYKPFPKFPEIYVEKTNNQWFYSHETVASINKLHRKTFPFIDNELLEFLPDWAERTFFGLSIAQYIGLILLVLIGFFLSWVLNGILRLIVPYILKRTITEESMQKRFKKVFKPLGLLVLFWVLGNILKSLHLPAYMTRFIIPPLDVLMHILFLLVVLRAIEIVSEYFIYFAQKRGSDNLVHLIPFFETFLQIIATVIALFYILQSFGVNPTALVAGLSIGGLAIALAAQETIKNLFGSITIFADRPFKVGDWIMADNIEGDVEEIGFRSTRIRTFSHSVVYIPNGRLADMTIDNFGMRIYRRFRTHISLTYDSHPDTIKAFVHGIRELVARNPRTRKDFYGVHLNEFGASSLNVLLYIYFHVSTTTEEWEAREEMMMYILDLAHLLGLKFAFPTHTVHIENTPTPPNLAQTPHQVLPEDLAQKVNNYVEGKFPAQT
jgi:MscS family membrane protein